MHAFWLLLFSITAGFTASAIIANLYRICVFKVTSRSGQALRAAVLVVAGPSVLFENAMRGRIAKAWNPVLFWLATAGVLYWSLAIGLLVLEVATHL